MRARIIGFSAIALAALSLPLFASAQVNRLQDLLGTFQGLLNAAIVLLITLAIVVFFWGLIAYLATEGAEGKAKGLKIMLYGILAIFIMFSIYGIIRLLQKTFNVQDPSGVPAPQVQPPTYIGGVRVQ